MTQYLILSMQQNVEICIKCFICTTKHTPFFGCTISFLSFEQAFLYVNMLEGLSVCAIEYNTTNWVLGRLGRGGAKAVMSLLTCNSDGNM